MQTLYRITKYFRPYLSAVLLSLFLNVSVSVVEAAMAIFVKPIFDEVFFGKNMGFLIWIPVMLMAFIILKGIFNYLHTYIMTRVCLRVVMKIRAQLYSHFLRFSMSQFDHTPMGTMTSRITADAAGLEQAVPTVINMFRQILTLLALLSVALYRDWKLTLVGVAVIPFTGIPVYFVSKHLKRNQKKSLKSLGSLTNIIYEAFSGMRVIKVFGTEDRELDKFKKENEHFISITMRNLVIGLTATPATEFITTLGVSIIFLVGGYHTIRGETTPGEFFSFTAAIFLMYRPVGRIADINKVFASLLAAGERVFDTIDEPPDVIDRPNAVELPPFSNEVHFNNVKFRYPAVKSKVMDEKGNESNVYGVEQKWAINGVDFKVRKGETVAIVGSSGAGKTTVSALLPRFYDVTEGSIDIDGIDIRDVTVESLRRSLAIVTQETFLFNETVAMNIGYGLGIHVDRAAIEAAAKAANAHEFISEMSNGYDTQIGERGIRLSGGQRQRLSIARAILRNAPILILDEATSSLDTESEREVQSALEALMKDRTTIVIAHRLSTIRNATRIVVLDQGRKIEEGTHEELIEKGGIYKRLYEIQFFGDSESSCEASSA